MIEWERIQGGKANLKRWVLSFDRNVETDNDLRVSGGREFQNLGAMTEKDPVLRSFYPEMFGHMRWTEPMIAATITRYPLYV